jgi:hypothetical protein
MAGDAARQQPNVPGGANGQRRAVANGAQPTDTAAPVLMREPLRFEGFYLQPGAFVPWVGGQLLARDPTQPNYAIPRGFQQHQQQQQRPRHTPIPSTSTGFVNPATATASVAPTPPAVTSPPMSASAAGSFMWPPTQTTIAPLAAKTQPDPTAKASEDEGTSSDSSSDAGDISLEERRRMAQEAVMKRLQSMQSIGARGAGAAGTSTKPTLSAGNNLLANERAYSKFFAIPSDASAADGAKPTFTFAVPRPSTTATVASGQYNVRHDAPSFIPLFHMFHQQQYGPVIGTSRPWPMQQATLPTQTLPFPAQNMPTISSQFSQPPQVHATGVHRRPPSTRIHSNKPLMSPQANPPSLPQQRSNVSLPLRDLQRDPSPSQELSLQQLDAITRNQVEERLKILENVKRMTQQCIDELMTVRGTMPGAMTRASSTDTRPVVEQEVTILTESLTVPPPLEIVAPAIETGLTPDVAVPVLAPPSISPLVEDPLTLHESSTAGDMPKEEPQTPSLELEATPEIISVEEPAAEDAMLR